LPQRPAPPPKTGTLPIEIVGVVSNRFDKVIVNHDIPFHHIKVTKENKPQAEARLIEVVEQSGAELTVLARYMQVLRMPCVRKCRAASSTSTTRSCRRSRGPISRSRPSSAA